MDQAPSYRCYFGAACWERDAWAGGFYPEDLPPEWRLAYYSAAFSCVYLPYAEWCGRDLRLLAAWVEDARPGFRFVLQANPAGATAADAARLAVLAPRLAAPVSPEGLIWLEDWPDLRQLAQELPRRERPGYPLYLISRTGGLDLLNRARILLDLLGM